MGVQWGNDPWAFPAVPKAGSAAIVQSVLNKKIGTPQHFGCNGRLAGPVDNKLSSCLACHANGYAPQAGLAAAPNTTPPIFGFPGECNTFSTDNAHYFTNNQYPMSYSGGQYGNLMNMDTSLQMQVAFEQYGQFAQYASRWPARTPEPHTREPLSLLRQGLFRHSQAVEALLVRIVEHPARHQLRGPSPARHQLADLRGGHLRQRRPQRRRRG